MSDNLPAVRPAAEVTTTDTDGWIEVMGSVVKLAAHIAGTEFVPKALRDSPPAVAAAMLYGREVGLPPMTALTQTHVIEGRPSMSAEAMRALIVAAGHEFEFVETTGAICTMRARRRGQDGWTSLAWTIDMARAAGLLSKANWKGYPRAMLVARCTAELARMVFPDVIHGFRAIEEAEDMTGEQDGPAAQAAGPKTTVKRSSKRGAAALPSASGAVPSSSPGGQAAASPPGPPLPGEDGYEDLGRVDSPAEEPAETADVVEGATDDGPQQPAGEAGNEPEETPSTTPEPGDELGPNGEIPIRPRPASRAQHRMIFGQLGELGVNPKDDEERLLIASKIATHPIGSFNELTAAEAAHIIDTLGRMTDRAELTELLDAIDAQAGESES